MARTQQKVAKTRGIKCSIHSMICVFIAVLVLGIVYMIGESKKLLDDRRENRNRGRSLSQCNLFSGKWVYDNKSYPLYREQHCLYQFDGVACEKDGRKDLNYQHWRWQPHDCDLPRFNAIAMLERLRGMRLVFVGDSITRNQWASMVCLLESFIPPALKSVNSSGSLAIFKVTLESNSDHPMNHHFSSKQIVRVQEIENHARHWTDADILVFNSYIWWRKPKLKALWGSFDGVYKEVDMPRGYEMALKTWIDGLDIHERGEKWGRSSGENCYNEKEPILEEGYEGSESDPEMMQKVEAAINELSRRGLKVQLLNITRLSEYRKDGHTSIYRKQWRRVTRQQLANPSSYADCVNWCNPGVPDVWNELLYAYITSQVVVPKTWNIRCSISSLIVLLAVVFVLGIFATTKESRRWLFDQKTQRNTDKYLLSRCDLFSGKWIYDEKNYPLYKEQHCSFMSLFNGVACERSGRMDLKYQHWRWQPHECDLPRFNAIAMLERLRNKRLVFVGDSLTRNQWTSMVCLLESSIAPTLKSVTPKGSLTTFKINLESTSDHPVHHHFSSEQILRVQAIEKHARHWTDADILVFDSYVWWRRPKFKVLWGSFESPNKTYKEVEMVHTLEMVLKTWSNWLEINVNRSKTKIYFVSMSAIHGRGEEWGKNKGENCYNETVPILKEGYHGSESDPRIMQKVEAAIDKLKRRGLKVQMLNITQLSEYRKDAHTTIYRRQWGHLTKEESANPKTRADLKDKLRE
ncbi:unnamed protein product [Camellia sinensis]